MLLISQSTGKSGPRPEHSIEPSDTDTLYHSVEPFKPSTLYGYYLFILNALIVFGQNPGPKPDP